MSTIRTWTSWTKEEDEIIINNFNKIKNWKEMVPMLPTKTYNSIKARGTKLGLRTSPGYTWNKDFFIKPTTMNCFVAGFLASDGYLTKIKNRPNSKKISIKLAQKDIDFLGKIKSIVEFTGPINKYSSFRALQPLKDPTPKEYFYCTIDMNGANEAFEHLYSFWRITPRKSLTLEPPVLNQPEHIFAYFLGYFYGDGWVTEESKFEYKLGLLGTPNLLNYFNDYFNNFFVAENHSIYKSQSKAWVMGCSQSITYIIIKCLIALKIEDKHMLDRKWNQMKQYVYNLENNKLPTITINSIKKYISPQFIDFINRNNSYIPEKFLK